MWSVKKHDTDGYSRMKNPIKHFIDSFYYGTMVGGMFCWIYTIGVAKQNDWLVLLDFNSYDEGMIEYVFMFVWLLVAIYKLIEYIVEQNRNK